jgi:quaternary ammonium compound-resistance protein SugE
MQPNMVAAMERWRPAPADVTASRAVTLSAETGGRRRGTAPHQPARDASAPVGRPDRNLNGIPSDPPALTAPMSLSWIALVVAGLLEVCWAVGLKYTDGFRRPIPSVLVIVVIATSIFLLSWSARTLPIGTAYGVWVGIGALGAAILGITLFGEPLTAARIGFLVMLLVAIVGLKVTSQA